jgi:hypothetical protein
VFLRFFSTFLGFSGVKMVFWGGKNGVLWLFEGFLIGKWVF